MNISELVAGGYKQAACVSPFYPGLGMIKTMTHIFKGPGFSMGPFSGAMLFQDRLIKGHDFQGQVLSWDQLFPFSEFLWLGFSGVWLYKVQGILGSGLSVFRFSGVNIFRCQVFQVSLFPGATFFNSQIFQGSSFSGVRSLGSRFVCGQFLWGQV